MHSQLRRAYKIIYDWVEDLASDELCIHETCHEVLVARYEATEDTEDPANTTPPFLRVIPSLPPKSDSDEDLERWGEENKERLTPFLEFLSTYP